MAQEVFKRYEKKYLLSREQYTALLAGMEGKIQQDEYGEYTICNIYFDTPDYELIRTSLEKPEYKEKLRLRSYGAPGREDMVFVEMKKKFDGVVYKRRAAMTLAQAEDYLYRGVNPDGESQIMHELLWFTARYSLKPAVCLTYDRAAYVGIEEEELRITFDTRIRFRETELYLEKGCEGEALLPEDKILMEVKVANRMPLWMSHLFSELEIFPISFSKYGIYFQKKLIMAMGEEYEYA